MSRIINRVRGIRGSFRPGQVITTPTSGTRGPAQLSDINELASQLTAAGVGGAPAAGNGVPSGGTNGQVLAKVAGAVAWSFTTAITAVGTIATGVWQGTKIALGFGGTGADLSATGPGFLKQATTGANVTVAALANSDLPASGVTAGSYTITSLTVNAQGIITAASSGAGGGSGTVTSVGLAAPSEFSVSGSPVTTSGTLTFAWANPVTVTHGGTGADMHATGPGYVKQATLGANFTTVSTIPYSDITGGPSASNFDVGDWSRGPSHAGRIARSAAHGNAPPAWGGICAGPISGGPITSDTLEWIVPRQRNSVDSWDNGARVIAPRGIPGTQDGDDAIAGYVGESASATGTGVTLTSATPVNATSLTLGPGDWDVDIWSTFFAVGGTVNATGIACGLSTTSATLNTSPGFSVTFFVTFTINSALGGQALSNTTLRFSLASQTTIFGVVEAIFTLGTASALKNTTLLEARRVR